MRTDDNNNVFNGETESIIAIMLPSCSIRCREPPIWREKSERVGAESVVYQTELFYLYDYGTLWTSALYLGSLLKVHVTASVTGL